MSAVANQYPLLKATILTGIVRKFGTNLSQFRGARWCPAKNYMREIIEWDILFGARGMTPAVQPDSPSPIRKHPKVAHKSFMTVEWREKFILGERDLVVLRKPGTWDEEYGEELIAERLGDLNVRVETRMEFLRYKMLTGSVDVEYQDGTGFTVDYEVPEANKPTTALPWSHEDSDPIKDVAAWRLLFRGTGSQATDMEMTQVTYNYLPANATLRGLIQYQFGMDLVRSGGITPMSVVQEALGGLPLAINDSGYIGDDDAYHPFILDDHVIVMGSVPAGEKRAEFAMTPNMHHGGQSPTPGKFARPIWFLDADPIRVEVVGGVYGLPMFYHPEWHLYAKVG